MTRTEKALLLLAILIFLSPFAAVAWASIEVALTVRQMRADLVAMKTSIDGLQKELNGLTLEVKPQVVDTIKEFSELTKEQRRFINQQETLWNSKDTQLSIGLGLRSLQQLNRASIELRNLIRNTNSTVTDFNDKISPNIASATANIDKLIIATTSDLDALKPVLDHLQLTTQEVNKILTSPELKLFLTRIVDVPDNLNRVAATLNVSVVELKESTVKLLTELTRLGKESADLVHGINKPVSRKEKVLRALIYLAAAALPGLIRR